MFYNKINYKNNNVDFSNDKNKYLNMLSNLRYKILFPKQMILDIKNIVKLDLLAYCLIEYNSAIIDSRKLFKKLNKLNHWGYLFDTYEKWDNKVNEVNIRYITYKEEILKIITSKFNLINEKPLIKFLNWIENMKIFMNISKNHIISEYIYQDFNYLTNKPIKKIFNNEQIISLLPLFTDNKTNTNNNYYQISDLFS